VLEFGSSERSRNNIDRRSHIDRRSNLGCGVGRRPRRARSTDPAPFVKTSEAIWVARIAELKRMLPTMSNVDATIAMTELVALLDSHSGLYPYEVGFHFYGIALFEFSDGVFVLNAFDRGLVGARLLRIGDTPVANVLTAITPLVNADNESALRDWLPFDSVVPEYLHAKGIVADTAHPRFEFRRTDGSTVTVDPPSLTTDEFGTQILLGEDFCFDPGPPFHVPTAVTRRGEQIYFELDAAHKAFVIHYNYSQNGIDTTEAVAAMRTAFDDGTATRVVLDVRYARGGAYDPSQSFRSVLQADKRINRPGGLYVVVSRESYSATTALVSWLDQHTAATFVGEPTPARANPLGTETVFTLPNSKLPVHFPTDIAKIAGPADTRNAVRPDIPVESTAAEFFSGADPALQAALNATTTGG
jgi:hypothetical protein